MRRHLFILAFAMVAIALNAQTKAATNQLRTKLSVNGCSQPMTLLLRAVPTKQFDIDPGDFDQIVFTIGAQSFRFNTTMPQMRLQPSDLNPPEDYAKLKGISIDRTGYFLRSGYHTNIGDRPLLLFLGWPYASDPGSLLIFGFRSDCTPYLVFHSDNFELQSLQTDSSGYSVLVGKHSLSQVMAGADGAWLTGKPYATTYDPYSVYKIGLAVEAKAIYSLQGSQSYNQAHYCWAGPKMSEAKAVVYNRTRKNQIECMSASRARNLIR